MLKTYTCQILLLAYLTLDTFLHLWQIIKWMYNYAKYEVEDRLDNNTFEG